MDEVILPHLCYVKYHRPPFGSRDAGDARLDKELKAFSVFRRGLISHLMHVFPFAACFARTPRGVFARRPHDDGTFGWEDGQAKTSRSKAWFTCGPDDVRVDHPASGFQ